MWPRISIDFLAGRSARQCAIRVTVWSPGMPSWGMIRMSPSGIPAALSWSAISFAMRGISFRLATVGISITCSNSARVRACHAGSSFDGCATGFGAAPADAARADADTIASSTAIRRMTFLPSRSAKLSGAVALGKIFGAAHFFQAADGAGEFEAAVALRVEAGGLGVGGGKQLDAMLVERVDHGHEARRIVAHRLGNQRDADEDDGVEAMGDGQIDCRDARFAAQALEREHGDSLQRFGHVQG